MNKNIFFPLLVLIALWLLCICFSSHPSSPQTHSQWPSRSCSKPPRPQRHAFATPSKTSPSTSLPPPRPSRTQALSTSPTSRFKLIDFASFVVLTLTLTATNRYILRYGDVGRCTFSQRHQTQDSQSLTHQSSSTPSHANPTSDPVSTVSSKGPSAPLDQPTPPPPSATEQEPQRKRKRTRMQCWS